MFAARLLEPFARSLRCAVFHDRRLNELIHSLGTASCTAARASIRFPCYFAKGVEGPFRQAPMAFRVVDYPSAMVTLPITLLSVRFNQIDDLGFQWEWTIDR